MVRRARKSPWAGVFQRSLNAMTRATLRASRRAVVKATTQAVRAAAKPVTVRRVTAKPAKVRRVASKAVTKRPAAAPGSTWTTGVAVGPAGARRYRLWRPPGVARTIPLPLLVMLHGCDQDATAFALSTRLQTLAAREGFMLLFPEQDRLANAHGCWNWFDTRTRRAQSEAASIVAAVDQVCLRYGADPVRVAIAGLSAGAGMASFTALQHPGRFKAVAMHSGVAPGAAHSTATARRARRGRRRPGPWPDGGLLPPLLVIQGSADHVVAPSNGLAAAQAWAEALGATAGAPRTVQRGQRRAMDVTDFKRSGRALVTLCEVRGLGHAWSGGAAGQPYSDPSGPDAGRMLWAFASRCFAQSAAKQ
jgi:poly(hydroxyalkanoate) depolymerase family esterase